MLEGGYVCTDKRPERLRAYVLSSDLVYRTHGEAQDRLRPGLRVAHGLVVRDGSGARFTEVAGCDCEDCTEARHGS